MSPALAADLENETCNYLLWNLSKTRSSEEGTT